MKVSNWGCADGTPDEDHDWKLIPGEPDVGIGDVMECEQCGKQREPTDQEVQDSYCDDWDIDLAN